MNFGLGLATSALEGTTDVPCRQEHFRLRPKADNGSFSKLAGKRQAHSAGLSRVDMTVGNTIDRLTRQAR